jgi:hypothetical protein
MAESQMAEEKKAEKEVFQHLAEYANIRISIGRMLKWPKLANLPCNRCTKKGLQDSGENFHFF